MCWCYTAFSRQPIDGRKYAQHEMLAHQDETWDLIEQGAQIFVCGNARTLAPGVRAALQQIYADEDRQHGRRGRDMAGRPAAGTPLSGGHLGSQLTARALGRTPPPGPRNLGPGVADVVRHHIARPAGFEPAT